MNLALPLVGSTLGWPELIIIVLVVLLLFGGRKLPEVARGTGRALRIFKAETKGLMDDDDEDDDGKPTTTQQSQQAPQPPQQITQAPVNPTAVDPSAPASSPAADPLPPTHT